MNELQQKSGNSLKIDQNTQSNSSDKTLFYSRKIFCCMSENSFQYLVPYENGTTWEGKICLFDSHTNSVEQVAKFTNGLSSNKVATAKDKVTSYVRYFK